MDSKGKTIAILSFDKHVFVRENLCLSSSQKIKIFNITFDSWHAEIRLVKLVMTNIYMKAKLKATGKAVLTVIRLNRSGKPAPNSKPCAKCMKVLKILVKRLKIKLEVWFTKNGRWEKIVLR